MVLPCLLGRTCGGRRRSVAARSVARIRSSVGPVTKNELVSFYDVAIPPTAPGASRSLARLSAAARYRHFVDAMALAPSVVRRDCIGPNKHR